MRKVNYDISDISLPLLHQIKNMEALKSEIKRILKLSEIAQAKVKFDFNGARIINPMQQAAATRLYTRAYNLKGDISINAFKKIHIEAISELNAELSCPDCDVKVVLISDMNTDWYGNLKHYTCKSCKKTFVSQDGGELE